MKHLKCLSLAVGFLAVVFCLTQGAMEVGATPVPPTKADADKAKAAAVASQNAALDAKYYLVQLRAAHVALYDPALALLSDEAFTDQMTQADYDEAWVLICVASQALVKSDSLDADFGQPSMVESIANMFDGNAAYGFGTWGAAIGYYSRSYNSSITAECGGYVPAYEALDTSTLSDCWKILNKYQQ